MGEASACFSPPPPALRRFLLLPVLPGVEELEIPPVLPEEPELDPGVFGVKKPKLPLPNRLFRGVLGVLGVFILVGSFLGKVLGKALGRVRGSFRSDVDEALTGVAVLVVEAGFTLPLLGLLVFSLLSPRDVLGRLNASGMASC